MPAKFVHLRLHSEFSLVDGLVRLKPLAQKIVNSMPAVALTDHMNLFAVVKFFKACESLGIKPLLGADIYLYNPEDETKPSNLLLLCQNNQGYANLRTLISRAYREGQQQGFPQIKKSWLWEHSEGLIVLSGAQHGEIGKALLNSNQLMAENLANTYIKQFPDRFYIELQRTGRPQEDVYIKSAISLAKKLDLPLVATNDVRFIDESDFFAHEARVCIHDGYTLEDPRREQKYSAQQYLKTPDEMQSLFADIPEALINAVEIAKRCNVALMLGEVFLPDFPIPDHYTIDSYLSEISYSGLEKRLEILFPEANVREQKRATYRSRLQIELDVIIKMGFPGYFLIVADFIQWSKNNGIPVGPGRGSGAGSLVAYVLGITDLDPLAYDLLFERFLNPERVSMPDFDVDFCMDGRDRVIDYVADKYGRDSVSQIITYGTMAAKAVIRDVGRVMGHPYGFVDKIAKLIPFEIGMTLEKALIQEDDLRQRYEEEEEVTELIDLAKKLEGITRNAGKHAGGVVIAPSQLTDFSALYCESGSQQIVTQFDKDDVEAVGLVKFDFLGLRTLTIINWAVIAANQRLAIENKSLIDINLIPLDDKASFDLLKACETTAVFQLESRGMKDLIKRLQPDCFEDIVALVALFRPGPLQSGMVDDFINRKHGLAAVEYPHPDLEPILKPTYGVILYQEQVMQIAQVLANYTLGAADLLRRAMGKKKPEEMAKQRQIFLEGSTARDIDANLANSIFDLMEKFAGYGFNKSHSAAYALVAYQTAWLKAHYPAEFMAAVLSSDMDNTDKVVTFLDDAKHMRLKISAPCINEGFYKFTAENNKVLYGLGAIKGVGESAIQNIVNERLAGGSYQDLFEFCERVDSKKINRRTLEALIRAGAMDCFKIERASLFLTIDTAIQAAEQQSKNALVGQTDLFGSSTETKHTYIAAKPWSESKRLRGEKDSLGTYVSGHPILQYQTELNAIITSKIGQLNVTHEQSVVIAGLVVSMRSMLTKRGDRMAFIALDDQSGRMEIAIFSDVFLECRELLSNDQIIIVQGDVSHDEYTGGLRMSARKIMSLEQARLVFAKALKIQLHIDQFGEIQLQNLKQCINKHAGRMPIICQYSNYDATAEMTLDKAFRIKPCNEALEELQNLFGNEAVSFIY
ncbi:MAG: DNA polymerase III subunit alpha [Legionellales bacterium]|nr:DNA polymerase III subunit alpha [Legionellales bacterium]